MLKQCLVTDRLMLRRHRRSDARAIAELLDDWDVARWLTAIPHPYTRRDAIDWIAQCERNWVSGKDYQFVVVEPASFTRRETIVGHIGLAVTGSPDTGELGYWFGRRYWGHGYGREAAMAVLEFGFDCLHLDRVEAASLPGNRWSRSILTAIGMRQRGIRLLSFHAEPAPVACPIYQIIRAELAGRKPI